MSDKTKTSGQSEAVATGAASTTQQQTTPQAQNGAAGSQAANMWNYHMYNMYGMYNMNMYQNFNHPYYQMLASQGYGTPTTGYQQTSTSSSPQMAAMDAYRNSFTSGGTLTSFNANTQSASPSTGTTTNTTVDTNTLAALTATTTTKVEEIELPPLPPGPPPPSVPPPPPPAPSPPPLPPTDASQTAALQQSPSVQACMTSPYAHYMAFNQNLYQQQINKSYQQQQQQSPQQTHQQNQYQTSKQQFNQTSQQQFNQTPQQQQGQYNFLYPPPTISGNQQQSANNQQQQSYGQTPNSGQQQNQNYGQQTPVQQQNQNYGQSPVSQKQNQNYGQSSGSRWDGGGGNTSKPEKETRWSQPNQQGPRFNQPNNNRNSRFNNNQQQQDGPIRFNMNRPRGRMNNANKAPLLSNPDWMSGKTKWQGNQNKLGQQQQGQPGKEKQMGSSQETGPTLSDEETLRKLVDGWPDNLKAYVDRCFSDCPPDKKDKLVVVLKSQLIKAANNGSLWCKQWQCEPMPTLEDDEQTPKKSGRMDTRMGYLDSQAKSPNKKKKKDRRSRGRSSSESSQSSQDGGYIEFSSSMTSKKKKNKDKKKNKFKHNIEESHYWNEFGMNGGKVETKKEVLDKRAARFNNDKGGNTNKLQAKVKPAPARMSTTSRFNQQHSSGQNSPFRQQHQQQSMDSFAMDVDTDFDISTCHIVGTCRDIEKPYLRLTTAPEPCQVRPPEVLKESLEFVKKKWAEKGDYRYVCEQLKSIRQDLTVQGIRDSFTVLVYETHAKIALETSDHAEFNQCQSQLFILHKEHNSPNRYEFTAYRLLYFIFTQDFMDVNTMLMSLSMEEKNNECISHAVSVMKAWLSSNYDKLLRLYSTSPRMSGSLMDWFIGRERKNALKIIIKAYRPTLPTSLLQSSLAFNSEENLIEFLKPLDLIYTDATKKTIDCKLSTTALQA